MKPAIPAAILAFIPLYPASGQVAAAPPSFEVATIKLNTSKDPMPHKERLLPGGQPELPNASLKDLIKAAYSVQDDRIVGAPAWLDSDRFDIIAKAPPATPVPALLLMMQTLLAERFELAIHREDKLMPVFALVVAKGGSRLQASAGTGERNCDWRPAGDGLRRRECHNITLAEFTRQLHLLGGVVGIDRPVVDLTGLEGPYDRQFDIRFQREGAAEGSSAVDAGPTIFDAMAQLGLKLEARKQPMPMIVIDHVERAPTGN